MLASRAAVAAICLRSAAARWISSCEVRSLAGQIPLALRHRPVDLRLLPHLARIPAPQRSLAAIQLLPGGGQQVPRAFQGLICAPAPAFCIGTESSYPLVYLSLALTGLLFALGQMGLAFVGRPLAVVGDGLPFVGRPLAVVGDGLPFVGRPLAVVGLRPCASRFTVHASKDAGQPKLISPRTTWTAICSTGVLVAKARAASRSSASSTPQSHCTDTMPAAW